MLLFQQFIHSCQMPVDHVEEEEEEATEGEEAEERTIENRKSKSQFVVGLKRGWERGGGLLPPHCLPFPLLFHSRVFRKCAVAVLHLLLLLTLVVVLWFSCQRM